MKDIDRLIGDCVPIEAAELERLHDEIERLRAVVAMLISNVETGSYESTGQALDEARAALERR